MTGRLFPALLKFWRGRRGLSQLELSLEADVSARHVSFLESGRAKPSEDMVLRLLSVLGVPLADQNEALRAAGYESRFAEPAFTAIAPEVEQALRQMIAQHEPFPLVVLSADSTIVRRSRGATSLFETFIAHPGALPEAPDMFTLLFDPRLMRPFVRDWEGLARSMISRLHRENLQRGGDDRLSAALERIFALPDIPRAWRQPDFSTSMQPTQIIRLERDDLRVGFLVTVTVFSAPQQVILDELRIESCFPLDAETRAVCSRFAAGSSGSLA